MIKYKVGDLIQAAKDGEVNVIAQQCNCFNARKRGIAPLIDEAFPEAGLADDLTIKGDPKKFGDFSYAYTPRYKLSIYNLYGQWGWWKREDEKCNTELYQLESAFTAMTRQLLRFGDKVKIGLPLLGCGLGGGNWTDVSKIIEETLCVAGFDVTVYVLNECDIPDGALVIS